MKTRILGLLSLFLFVFTALGAVAFADSSVPIRRIYNTASVFSTQYAQLIASTVRGVKGVQVNNTGTHAVELAFGASGSEAVQLLVGVGQDTAFLPLAAGYATRLSVIALDGTNDTGELDVNVFYN